MATGAKAHFIAKRTWWSPWKTSPGTPFYANAKYLFYYRGYPSRSTASAAKTSKEKQLKYTN